MNPKLPWVYHLLRLCSLLCFGAAIAYVCLTVYFSVAEKRVQLDGLLGISVPSFLVGAVLSVFYDIGVRSVRIERMLAEIREDLARDQKHTASDS